MMLPLSVRPAGRPLTSSVAPAVSVNVAANGSPTVPDTAEALIAGRGHALTGMSMLAVAPQAAVMTAWIVPVAVAVPVMRLPLSVRPAGSPVTLSVAPSESTNVVANGSPTVPLMALALMAGSGHGLMTTSVVAVAPQFEVAVR